MANVTVLTEQMLDWLKANYYEGSWEDLAKLFNAKFKTAKSADAIRILFNRYKKSDLSGSEVPFANFTRDTMERQLDLDVKEGRFFVTGVMPMHRIKTLPGMPVVGEIYKDGFRTIVGKEHFAKPILLPMIAHTVLGEKQPSHYDSALTPYKHLFASDVIFNEHLRAVDIRVNPQQKRPLTGIEGLAYDESLIVASPRQHLEFACTGNEVLPRLLCSTGSINWPGYQNNRIGNLAANAHVMGGLIVELKGDKFFARKVRFDDNGGYYDLASYHHHSGVTSTRVEALNFGDIHIGHHDEALIRVAIDLIQLTRPKRLIFHDVFDGLSISHHTNFVAKLKRPDWAYSLETEAALARSVFLRLKEAVPKDAEFIFVDANHNNFLSRYLSDRRYMDDAVNFKHAHELMLTKLNGKNPLAELLNLNFVKYLGPNQDLFIAGVQVANHGDRGVNGMRGRAHVKRSAKIVMSGHLHTPFEDDGHTGLGMWCNYRHGYNAGPSTWMPSCGIIHEDGSTQQVIPIKSPKSKNPNYTWKL